MGILRIGDHEFQVKRAEIFAVLPDPHRLPKGEEDDQCRLAWQIEIETEYIEIEGVRCAPYLYFEELPISVNQWTSLVGVRYTWQEPYMPNQEPNGGVCCFEHEDLLTGDLRIGDRNGLQFETNWKGTCDNFIDESEKEVLDYEISTSCVFTGVIANVSSKDTPELIAKRLSRFIDITALEQGSLAFPPGQTYGDGIGVSQVFFTPRPEVKTI